MTRTYAVETYGCQMNVHDSERIAGLLDDAGFIPVEPGNQADIVVFNTCAVRENADNKLYGNLSFLAPIKKANPNMQIAVGGCLAQKDQATILKKAPYVDVVFGTHNVGSLPALLERARIEEESQVEILESLEHFPSTLPARRLSAFSSWVSVSVGCNNTCTFCIVPTLRGIEKDRSAVDILREVRALVEQGVIEITLLGQNVNAYGVDFGDRSAFANLLKECGKIDGLDRVRFMSPHPRDFTDDVIEAMATTHNVMPHLHMPLQSGSNSILQAQNYQLKVNENSTHPVDWQDKFDFIGEDGENAYYSVSGTKSFDLAKVNDKGDVISRNTVTLNGFENLEDAKTSNFIFLNNKPILLFSGFVKSEKKKKNMLVLLKMMEHLMLRKLFY